MGRTQILVNILLLGYILGIQDGFITLWTSDIKDPVVFPYRAELLPEADRAKLEDGIHIEDSDHLRQLMEDYLS